MTPQPAANAKPGSPIFNIPRLDRIAIDGDAADWGDAGYRVDVLAAAAGEVRSPREFDAAFQFSCFSPRPTRRGCKRKVNQKGNDDAETSDSCGAGRFVLGNTSIP